MEEENLQKKVGGDEEIVLVEQEIKIKYSQQKYYP